MASGERLRCLDSHASNQAAAAELKAGFARNGSAPSSTTPAARAAAVRYGAFISYSHAASAEVARGLQKWLQTYAKPVVALARRQRVPRRNGLDRRAGALVEDYQCA